MDPALLLSVDTLVKGGPGLIFAVLWWLERRERLALADKLLKTVLSMGDMNAAWLKVLKDGTPR
jgi:hypothetical protein